VTTFLDELNNDGNCSLREAIRAANLNTPVDACPAGSATGMDIILLGSGVYLLTIPGTGEDLGLTGDLDILGNTQIGGNGPDNTIIDTNHLDRAFEVISPAPPDTITVKFTSLTIRNGSTPSTGLRGGGGILNNAYSTLEIDLVTFQDNLTQQTGGGLDNIGTARLNNVTLTGNQSVVVGAGGGIFNSGNITLSNSLFYNNSSTMYGGGLDNSLRASLFNITFSGNSSAEGGGVFNDGEIDVYNSTFTANSSGFYHQGSAQRIKNTIIANNTPGDNCAGTIPITSLGHNLDSGSTCNFNGFGDQQNTDPLLGPLENNLGPTLTHALLTSSPAIDTGDNNDCPTTDQRGSLRPANGGFGLICDIGAFELNALFPRLIFLPITNR
jgi:CSLREA domain-containing protein